jgi:GNAT superfamily N-acetyltransferase
MTKDFNFASDVVGPVLLTEKTKLDDFDCGNNDLNEFLKDDALIFQNKLLNRTWLFYYRSTNEIIAYITVSNDAIRTQRLNNKEAKHIRRRIAHEKGHLAFPATLIGRLAVNKKFQRHGVGSSIVSVLRYELFQAKASRFFTVDALNDENVLSFYCQLGFKTIYDSQEREALGENVKLKKDERLKNRMMYLDLLNN